MALTLSQMAPLGSKAPDFFLPDTDGKTVRLSDFAFGKPLLVMFICNHCPYVKHIRRALASLTSEFMAKGVNVVAINSNDIKNYPADSPDKMKIEKKEAGYAFPYLFDESQDVARKYHAACTPDFFLYDGEHQLYYRGQFDGTRPGQGESDGSDLRIALDAVLAGKPVLKDQKPSMGCNIKWK